MAREHIEDAIILDGDQIIFNPEILAADFVRSGYNAVWTDEPTKEWLMTVTDGIVTHCSRIGGQNGWQLHSVSRWTAEDGQKLKKHLPVICIGVVAGTIASLGSVYLLCMAFGVDKAITASLLPKSVTTAIGVALSQEFGGIAAITTAVIVITGVLGSIIGPLLCKLLRLKDPIAQGVAFGTAAHVIGTTKAAQMSELAGAVSSFSLTFAGLVTSILMSVLAQFI